MSAPDLYHLAASMHAKAGALRQEADRLDVDADALHALLMAPGCPAWCGEDLDNGPLAFGRFRPIDGRGHNYCSAACRDAGRSLGCREVKWIDSGSLALEDAAVMLGNLIGGHEPRMHCNMEDYTWAGLHGERSRVLLAHGHGWLIPRMDIPSGRVVSG